MASISYTEMLLAFVSLYFLCHWFCNRHLHIIEWPVFGMLPGLLSNLESVHDYATTILTQTGCTREFKGPWFCNLDFVITCDPLNTHHILSKSFPNYPKGPDFRSLFEPLGDGILAADSDSWKFQRKMTQAFLKNPKFHVFLEKTVQEKVFKSLFRVLDHLCDQELEVNIQDVFQRLSFDIICLLILGHDPNCLSVEFTHVPHEKALNDMEEAVLFRHIVPGKYWKLLKWLQVGSEKKLTKALEVFDDFAYQCISAKREKMDGTEFDFLTYYALEEEERDEVDADSRNKFLRDATINLMVAGRDSTSAALSWFFYLLATNKSAERRILEEIKEKICPREARVFGAEDVSKLVYLHAALCETLRLYPSVPINHKCTVQADTLPSGLRVEAGTKVYISFYSMGRMEEIWGKDCYEFRPERWITKHGGIVHVPSYKFTAFNAGPRSCLGKDMSFTQMKIIVAATILNYQLQVVEPDRIILPSNSVLLHMKHGLKVRVTKRSV